MKRLLVAAFACLLGFGTAWAAVEGNNTAVVIRKAPVVSDNGYQFLCVPVRGFDITGQGKAKGLPLNDVIPPTTEGFTVGGVELVIEGNDTAEGYAANGTYELATGGDANVWQIKTGTATTVLADDADLFANGARIWLKTSTPSGSSAEEAQMDAILASLGLAAASSTNVAAETATAPDTIFAGEQVTLAEGKKFLADAAIVPGQMLACGNNTSEPIDVRTGLIDKPQRYDQVLRVQEGSDEYCYLYYTGSAWGVNGTNQDASADATFTIQPGEAFYFYRYRQPQP